MDFPLNIYILPYKIVCSYYRVTKNRTFFKIKLFYCKFLTQCCSNSYLHHSDLLVTWGLQTVESSPVGCTHYTLVIILYKNLIILKYINKYYTYKMRAGAKKNVLLRFRRWLGLPPSWKNLIIVMRKKPIHMHSSHIIIHTQTHII